MPEPLDNGVVPPACAVCGAPTCPHRGLRVAVWRCRACGTRFLRDVPQVVTTLDEQARVEALEPLRRDNAQRVLTRLQGLLGAGRRLLDVGCAHGWFVLAAQRAGFEAQGIDPDAHAIAHARALGANARQGDFPDDVSGSACFDALTFNDVFEHLSAPRVVLAHCKRLLAPGGVLVLNLPSRHGLLYRLAEGLAAFGARAPLERLYQLPFPSPHLYYFGEAGIAALAHAGGLHVLARERLPVLTWRTLPARLRMDASSTRIRRWSTACALAVLLPVLRLWPRSDIEVFYLGHAKEPR